MLRLEWNALRRGDRVLVHDDLATGLPLLDGVVTIVQPRRGRTDIAVRVDREDSAPPVVRPRRLAVHLVPMDPMRSCWRCELTSRQPPPTPVPAAGGSA